MLTISFDAKPYAVPLSAQDFYNAGYNRGSAQRI
jgi:hypothetical protein